MKVENAFKIVCIGDIHVDAVPNEKLFEELSNYFIRYIRKYKDSIDMIAILGDYWDKKIPLNSESAIRGIKFMNNLVSLCEKNDILIRVIKGTKTHDNNQLENFRYLEKKTKFRFKIINTVEEEEIDGVSFLYVPEEYMNDQDSYYQEYKEKKYDVMLGHGTWDICAFQNQIIESERYISGSPVFKYPEWEDVIKYNIIFGHIHTKQRHKKLYYTGSYSRWIFGEEKSKGFIDLTLNLEDETSNVRFITNKDATEYLTINLSDIDSEDDTVESRIEGFNKLVSENPDKRYRVRIDKEDLEVSDLDVLKEYINNENNNLKDSIKLELKSVSDSIKDKEEENYDFLGNDIDTNIKKFIEFKEGVSLTLEEIRTISLESE